MRTTPVEQIADGQGGAVRASAFGGDGLEQPVAFTLGGAHRTTVSGALAALGFQALSRGG